MKRVTLKEANKSLRIIVKETGYELHNGVLGDNYPVRIATITLACL